MILSSQSSCDYFVGRPIFTGVLLTSNPHRHRHVIFGPLAIAHPPKGLLIPSDLHSHGIQVF